jgi:hypothetical protein
MISYRFKRRAFLTAVGGGVGLKILLRNMEAAATTSKSPARLLVTHWPVGIVAGTSDVLFAATSGSVGGSVGLRPFADAGLGPDMTVIKGISTPVGPGGGHEGGTVGLVTGVMSAGVRSGQPEADDAYAAGPSYDQRLLANVPSLKAPGADFSYVNAACDTRTDFGEVSTKCLSYSTQTQAVPAASGPGQENIPLRPTLNPLTIYNNLFAKFAPTAAPPAADATLTNLSGRRSMLDFVAQELSLLRRMGPSQARMKLDNHFNAVTAMEDALTRTIDTSYPRANGRGGAGGHMGIGGVGGGGAGGAMGGGSGAGGGGGGGPTTGCSPKPPPDVRGRADGSAGSGSGVGDPSAGATDDAPNLMLVGAAHFAVLKAAFICDLLRCGTLLWAPGTNHVGFKGLQPGSTATFKHHPQSHRVTTTDTLASSTVGGLIASAQFLLNAQLWFFARQAENLKDWKASIDGFGNSLLDHTVVPFVTEVLASGHERSRMPAMIIGGKALGFVHDIYRTGTYTVNQYWGTIAQAFGHTSTDPPFAAPISGLWNAPA